MVIAQLRAKGLFPSLGAPIFNATNGAVPLGHALLMTHTNVSGTIYYTLDSSDPRRPGGAINPTAIAYSAAITVNTFKHVRARVRNGTEWSPIVEVLLFPLQDFSHLIVSEIMYNPPTNGVVPGDEYEFVEFKNAGSTTLDLSSAHFTDGITFTFTNGTMLAPGQFFVIGRNALQLQSKYPGLVVKGIYTGRLDNAGEKLTLTHALGAQIVSLTYNDYAPWPVAPDGGGFSIVSRDANANPDPSASANWRASSAVGGSPGADDPPSNIPAIVVNEVLTHTLFPNVDRVELFNPTGNAVNIGGWFLTDDSNVPKKFRIPNGTIIPAFGHVFFTEANFNPTPGTNNSFSLDSFGEEIYLLSGNVSTNLTGYSHGFAFGAAAQDVSFGRYINSVGDEQYPAQITDSFGATNSGPRVGPVVINEIQYHPDFGSDEFIEIFNIAATNVMLFDPNIPTNSWKLDGLGFTFPTNITLPPFSFLLLVQTNPAIFRAKYGVPVAVQILGPFAGQLQDSGENLELKRPGVPTTNGVPYITIDAVRYNDKLPWPISADGAGPSLQRLTTSAYGNDPINWFASGNTPGATNYFNAAPTIVITNPAPNSTFIPPADITINAIANDSDGAVNRVEFFASGVSLGEATSAPYSVVWSNAAAGTYSLTARARDNDFGIAISTPVTVTIFQPVPTTVVPAGSAWKYYDKGTDLGTSWTNINYSDNTWSNGLAQLGYGDGDEITRVEDNLTAGYIGTDTDRYITTYFRRSFVISNAPRFLSLQSSVRRDDGVVVYLNGAEVQRDNMPMGPVAFNTPALAGAADDGNSWLPTNVNSALLINGTNILAVEIHQSAANSSDISFDLELTGALGPVTPRIDLNSPTTNSVFTEPASIAINATATDIDGQLTSVKFMAGATELVEFANAPFNFNWTNVIRGAYTLTAIARNDTGLTTTSAPVGITVVTNIFPSVSITTPTNGTAFANRSNIVIAAAASDANGSVSKVEFFANDVKLGEDTAPPDWSFTWPLAPFGSHSLYIVATDNQNARATSGVVNIGVLNFTTTTPVNLIPAGAVWKFFDKGMDLGTTWITTNSDLTWSNGPAQLGYGDNDEATRVEDNQTPGYVVADQNRYITTYFRRAFAVSNVATVVNLFVNVLRDDGAVVYLNGTEVFRSNMPTGAVNYLTPAPTSVTGGDESTVFYGTNVSPALLIEGTNVIAVEIHQNAASSSDISFDLTLSGVRGTAAPVITVQPSNQTAAPGASAAFVVAAAGTAPLAYQWRFSGTNLSGATNATLMRSNIQPSFAGNYLLIVTNSLGAATSQVATLTVTNPDTDSDGMPDAWEFAYGLDLNEANDASDDEDGDGMTNIQEFRAGTSPIDATSVLKLSVTIMSPLQLRFIAQPNLSYAVQFQTNIASNPWFALSNVAPQSLVRTVMVSDPSLPTNVARFYRVMTP